MLKQVLNKIISDFPFADTHTKPLIESENYSSYL